MTDTQLLDAQNWNPLDPQFRHDPIPWYRALREQSPVHEDPSIGIVLSRYEDIELVLRDDRFGVSTPEPWLGVFNQIAAPALQVLSENMLLFIDPDQHTRVRRLVSKAFTARRVEELRPRLEAAVDEMIDNLRGAGQFDLLTEIAEPFPMLTITELLGVPDADGQLLHEWTVAVTAFDELPLDFEALPAAGEAAQAFLDYCDELILERQKRPGDDLVSALIVARDEGEQLTHDELRAMLMLLLLAGHDTTMSLISTGIWLLLNHPEAAEQVRKDPAAAPGAVEEIIRYLGPLQVASGGGRWPAEPVELNGVTLQPGMSVRLLLGSANRDPEAFENPDEFDITRSPNRHLGFGKGQHFCVGAALGRLEGQIVIPRLLQQFPNLALVDPEPTWRPTFVTRQLATLPLTT